MPLTSNRSITYVALRIWVIAAIINIAFGSYIYRTARIPMVKLFAKGVLYTFIFSLPVFLIMLGIYHLLMRIKVSFGNILLTLLFIGNATAFASFLLFSEYQQLSATYNIPLAICVSVATTGAILIQSRSINKECYRRDDPDFFVR